MCGIKLYLIAFVSYSLLIGNGFCASTFPADINRCRAGDVECIKSSSIALIRSHATTGHAASGFPIVEPFLVKKLDISDGRGSSVGLKLIFKDLLVKGLSTLNIDNFVGFERDPSTSKFEMHGSAPKIQLQGKYTADGRILILPITGEGDADITVINPTFSLKFKPTVQQRDGKSYLVIDKIKTLIEPKGLNIKLTNLFNGDQTLGTNLNQFLNENWSDVWKELQPAIQTAIAEILKSVIQPLFQKFPYDDIYLEA